MYIVDVSRKDLVKLFVERVKDWTDDDTVINLYKMMYEEHLIDNPAYYGNEIHRSYNRRKLLEVYLH